MDETTNNQNTSTQNQVPVINSQSDSQVVNFLINRGFVKSESTAKVLIIVLCVLVVSVSLYFAFSDSSDTVKLPEGAKIIQTPGQLPRVELPTASESSE